MEANLELFFANIHWSLLLICIALLLFVLGKSADALVEQAVELSGSLHIPQIIVGATIVSLGTTTPEAAVSVLAAVQGSPGLALGNSVGSVITDTGLILGLACLIAPLKLNPKIVNRQGWIQIGAGMLLVLLCIPWNQPGQIFQSGGKLSQLSGAFLLLLLVVYLFYSVRWAGQQRSEEQEGQEHHGTVWLVLLKLLAAIVMVVLSAHLLIPSVTEAAYRISVPESIIAATLVAFGTSLPELVTAVTAARRGHGELAVGNVIGADILNVFFVAGAAAAVTPAGLVASESFFRVLFPAMLFILIVFRVGVILSGDTLKRSFGYILLLAYLLYLAGSYYLLPGGVSG